MRASCIGCIGTHANGRQVTRLCYVVVTSSCEIASQHIQGLLEAYFKVQKNSGEQEKESIIHVRVG